MDEAFGHWLAGFIDGEGSFGIYRTNGAERNSYSPKFSLRLRSDDIGILINIKRTTGIGKLSWRGHYTKGKRHSFPSVAWQIQSHGDCLALIEILDRYPLRAKKRRDYEIWKEAVALKGQVRRACRSKKPNDHIWTQLAALQEQLQGTRAWKLGPQALT